MIYKHSNSSSSSNNNNKQSNSTKYNKLKDHDQVCKNKTELQKIKQKQILMIRKKIIEFLIFFL